MKYDIFISYSRKDMAVADRVCRALDQAGITYFIDRQGIAGGMEFPDVLAAAIIDCKLFLLLASANSYASKFTSSEITFAFNEKPRNTILPYLIDKSEMPPGMRFIFSGINWRTLEEHPVETVLVNDLLQLLGRSVPAQPKPESPQKRDTTPTKSSSTPDIKSKLAEARKLYHDKAYSKAFPLFEECARNEDPAAALYLGLMYHFGYGVEKNMPRAFDWYAKGAKAEHPQAIFMMGMLYYYGDGVERSTDKAIECYLQASQKGNPGASYELGRIYETGYYAPQSYQEAFKWFSKASSQGSLRGEYQVGRYYLNGYGVPEDEARGRDIILAVANKGEREAQTNMGYIRMNLDKNLPEAIRWFRLAAKQGDPDARKQLDRLGASL